MPLRSIANHSRRAVSWLFADQRRILRTFLPSSGRRRAVDVASRSSGRPVESRDQANRDMIFPFTSCLTQLITCPFALTRLRPSCLAGANRGHRTAVLDSLALSVPRLSFHLSHLSPCVNISRVDIDTTMRSHTQHAKLLRLPRSFLSSTPRLIRRRFPHGYNRSVIIIPHRNTIDGGYNEYPLHFHLFPISLSLIRECCPIRADVVIDVVRTRLFRQADYGTCITRVPHNFAGQVIL